MFKVVPLVYPFDALEPLLDAKTVEIHYLKHHQTYCDKLNSGLVGTEFENYKLEDLLLNYDSMPDNLRSIIKNHAGGLHNHNIYRSTMTPGGSAVPFQLETEITKSFGNWDNFEKEFKDKAIALFGSGRTWLEKSGNNLIITNYSNQENPLMYGKIPLLGIDIREHAYYLLYQNRRIEYINARRSLINWESIDATLHNSGI